MKKRFGLLISVMVLILTLSPLCAAEWKVADTFGIAINDSARGTSISPDGAYLYIAEVNQSLLRKYDLNTKEVVITADMGKEIPGIFVKSVFADSSGAVWIPGSSIPSIFRGDANLANWTEFKLSGFGIVKPEGVIASGKGEVYVPDREGKKGLYKFIVNGNKLELDKSWGKNGHALDGILIMQPGIDPDGNVVAGDYGDYSTGSGTTIYRVDKKTGEAKIISKDDLTGPYHIWVGTSGTIYVAQYRRGFSILSADGKLIKSFAPKDLKVVTEVAGVTADLKEEKVFILDQQLKAPGYIKVLMDN